MKKIILITAGIIAASYSYNALSFAPDAEFLLAKDLYPDTVGKLGSSPASPEVLAEYEALKAAAEGAYYPEVYLRPDGYRGDNAAGSAGFNYHTDENVDAFYGSNTKDPFSRAGSNVFEDIIKYRTDDGKLVLKNEKLQFDPELGRYFYHTISPGIGLNKVYVTQIE